MATSSRGSLFDTLSLCRRDLLKAAGLAGVSWLTPVAHVLGREEDAAGRQGDTAGRREPAQSIIFLWLAGGPSQLETFDPHPGRSISGETKAIDSAVPGIKLAQGLERTAERMGSLSIVRSLVTKEGDHERGTYLVKTGYSPLPVLKHPSIGAICCHELPGAGAEIPRHISILPSQWYGRGGFLGDQYDAFKTGDPINPVPDVLKTVSDARLQQRLADLDVVEQAFSVRRSERVKATLHRETVRNARTMMSSEQLKAFDVKQEPKALLAAYGDTPFGRGCLAARRLIERKVRCVEVTLDGWDSHANNHEIQASNVATLDPAFSALIDDLKQRGLLEKTIVLCGGEFGRTPNINPLGGRDHWPSGFSMALAGGGLRGGLALGATDPDGRQLKPEEGYKVPDVHATVLAALGLDPTVENIAPGPRPIKLSEGTPIRELLG